MAAGDRGEVAVAKLESDRARIQIAAHEPGRRRTRHLRHLIADLGDIVMNASANEAVAAFGDQRVSERNRTQVFNLHLPR